MNAPAFRVVDLFTRAEVDAEVKSATDYLGANLHEAFTDHDVAEAVETLRLAEHERPEGAHVPWNGNRVVRNTETLVARLASSPTVAEVRAACVLLLTGCAEAEQQREDFERRGVQS